MNDQPVLILLMLGIGAYVFSLWLEDLKAARDNKPNPSALPGATSASIQACAIAAGGALVILAAETLGELGLGLSEEQSTMTVLFAVYSLMAAFIEELIFRGFIVVEGRGKVLRISGVIGASLLFALLHPFLWAWEDDGFEWTLTAKGWFSTALVFTSSLWFYYIRFAKFNPSKSLIPCIVAHATKNLGVFAIKAAQGFIAGWW
jgi:uncharacterized protein